MTEIKLGLCNPPEAIYLYVKKGESDGKTHLWYQCNVDENNRVVPIYSQGLCGKITEIRITHKEFNGTEKAKLEIVIAADQQYIIRSGLDTYFTKTFLLAITQISSLDDPLIISVAPGDNTVVFSRVYSAITKQRYKAEWNANADWAQLVADAQSKLGETTHRETWDYNSDKTLDRNLVNTEIESIMKRKNIGLDKAKLILKQSFGVQSRSLLNDTQLAEFLAEIKKL